MYVAISMVVEMFRLYKMYGSKKDLKGKSQQNGYLQKALTLLSTNTVRTNK